MDGEGEGEGVEIVKNIKKCSDDLQESFTLF